MMMLSVPLLLLTVATVIDFRTREVPDWIPIALLVWAAFGAYASSAPSHGWLATLAGFGFGSAVGLLLFWRGGFGGGDAKLLAAMGAFLGPEVFLRLLVYIALVGGVLAVVAAVRGKREIAYAPAIAVGFVILMISPGMH